MRSPNITVRLSVSNCTLHQTEAKVPSYIHVGIPIAPIATEFSYIPSPIFIISPRFEPHNNFNNPGPDQLTCLTSSFVRSRIFRIRHHDRRRSHISVSRSAYLLASSPHLHLRISTGKTDQHMRDICLVFELSTKLPFRAGGGVQGGYAQSHGSWRWRVASKLAGRHGKESRRTVAEIPDHGWMNSADLSSQT